mgnify:FL=1
MFYGAASLLLLLCISLLPVDAALTAVLHGRRTEGQRRLFQRRVNGIDIFHRKFVDKELNRLASKYNLPAGISRKASRQTRTKARRAHGTVALTDLSESVPNHFHARVTLRVDQSMTVLMSNTTLRCRLGHPHSSSCVSVSADVFLDLTQ